MMSFLKMRVQRGKTAFTDVVTSHEELRCYQMAFEPHHRSSLQG